MELLEKLRAKKQENKQRRQTKRLQNNSKNDSE